MALYMNLQAILFLIANTFIQIQISFADTVVSKSFTIPQMFGETYQKKLQKESPNFPTNSAIITFANEYHWELVKRQIANLNEDVLSTYIIVAMDIQCFKFCQKLKYVDCVLGANIDVPGADFLRPSYIAITYFKWHVAKDAIKIFDNVFILDADIVVMKNPWVPIMRQINKYDTWYQMGKKINSGQLVFRSSPNTIKYIDYVINEEVAQVS